MRLAPPITVAAITRSSQPMPMLLSAEPCQPVSMTEAIAAVMPETM
jgi:hypothetical protein